MTSSPDRPAGDRRDPAHWLHRFTAEEWLRAGMRELGTARSLYARHDARPGLASARRAAGMGWNAVLALDEAQDAPGERGFGRTYVEHLRALANGTSHPEPIPAAVRDAAKALLAEPEPRPGTLVQLLSPRHDSRLVDAAETILAEAYARLLRRGLIEPGRATAGTA
jgi:hypothetical protein